MTGTTTIGSVYHYDNGQARVEFCWNDATRDGYAWSHKRQQRLASYSTLRETRAAYQASDNAAGAYGCALLVLRA